VLPVVDEFSRFPVTKCCGASTELRPGIDDEDALAPFCQGSCGTQAGESSANDRDGIGSSAHWVVFLNGVRAGHGHHAPSVVRAHVIAAMTARSGLGMRMTREKTS